MSTTNIKINSLRTEYDFLRPYSDTSLISLENTALSSQLNNQVTLEGALGYLSRIYAYWWKREIKIPVYGEKLTSYSPTYLYKEQLKENQSYNGKTWTETWQCSNSVSISSSGIVTLSNPTSYQTIYKWLQLSNGAYALQFQSGITPSYPTGYGQYLKSIRYGNIIKANKGAISINIYDENDSYTVGLYHYNATLTYSVSSQISSYNTTTDYIFSFNRNAYPDSRTSRQYTYTYLGIPFENARGS